MRQRHAGTWGVLALSLAFTLVAVALAGPAESAVAPVSVVIHDHGTATVVQPGSARFREMGALGARLVGAARARDLLGGDRGVSTPVRGWALGDVFHGDGRPLDAQDPPHCWSYDPERTP